LLGFVLRRLLTSILVLLAASVLAFAMVASLGDPLASLRAKNPPPSAEYFRERRAALNLDKPVIERYWLWLKGFSHGDMGRTLDGKSVSGELGAAFWVTMRMSIAATLMAVFLALLVGVYSAVRQYSVGDYAATFTSFVFLSMPVFWLALLLKRWAIGFVNQPSLFGWHPWHSTILYTTGQQSPTLPHSLFARLGDYAGHLLLPSITLALVTYASWSRYQRAEMLEVLDSDYVRLARAKGVKPRRVMVRHALRNALIPFTTVVAIDIGAVVAGAVITEYVFGWHGMGFEIVTAVRNYDTDLLLAWLMLTGVFVIGFNLIADILYGVLDPRSHVT